jgi:Fe2+ or Zn2+ uptake regulation protein
LRHFHISFLKKQPGCVNIASSQLERYNPEAMNMKRQTPLKKEVLQLLKRHHFLTVPQLVEKLHTRNLPVNKTSVYRTIESFLKDEVVCQQTFENELVYELQADHHDHLYCTNCGKVEKTDCQLEAVPAEQLKGFSIDHHHLTLYGRCARCS